MTCAPEFSVVGYRELIATFERQGYRWMGYRDFAPQPGVAILRHDIDFSLEFAVQQAQLNLELDLSATFFMLLSSDQYNLASRQGREALRTLVECGQRIGLHFDASLYPQGVEELERNARRECVMLQDLVGCEIEAVSFHRPVKELQNLPGLFAELPHAYEPRFFMEIEYCSDSRGDFHHGLPFDRQAFYHCAPFHLLTHPIWWMREEPIDPVMALRDFRRRQSLHLETMLAANCQPYAEYLEGAAFTEND